MKSSVRSLIYAGFLAAFAFAAIPASAQQSCESLKSVKIPNVTITSATAGKPGFKLPGQAGPMGNVPARTINVPFCRVQAYSAPTSDSHIGIEVWLPDAANWNGNFLAAGIRDLSGRSPAAVSPKSCSAGMWPQEPIPGMSMTALSGQ